MGTAKASRFCGNVSSYSQDSVWSWFICLCSSICMMLTLGFSFALGVLFPVLMNSFNENRERTAWVSSIVVGFLCVFGPVMGAFLNKFGIRIATILGCLLCSAALAAGSFAKSLNLLYISFSCSFGMGISLIYVTVTIVASHYFEKRRSVALGIMTAGQGLGTMILGPTLQALVDMFDWRNTFRVFAGVLALASLTGFFMHKGTSSPVEKGQVPSGKFSFNLSLFKNPTFLMLIIMAGVYTFSRMVPYVHLIKYCDDLGISANKSSTLYLFIGIFATLGRFGAGFLCTFTQVKPRTLFQVVCFTLGASTMLLTVLKTYGALVAYAIVFSLSDGLMVTSFIIEFLNSVEESKKSSALGYSMLVGGAGAMASPPLSGFMADRFGNYTSAFLMGGGVGVIASLMPFLLLCLKQESKKSCESEIMPLDIIECEDVAEEDLTIHQDVTKLVNGSVNSSAVARKNYERSASFVMAMKSPV